MEANVWSIRPMPALRMSSATRAVRLLLAAVTVPVLLAALVDRRSAPPPMLGVSSPAAVPVANRYHVVMPGDTLWSIAADLDASADPRPLVDALVSAHGGSTVRVGERIALPPGP